jgi:hypothetical protein
MCLRRYAGEGIRSAQHTAREQVIKGGEGESTRLSCLEGRYLLARTVDGKEGPR